MAEYHVGCGAFGIYAGTLNSRNKNMWRNKTECTDEAICAVRDYLVQELLGGLDCKKATSSGYEWTLEDMPYNEYQHSNPICSICRKTALLDGGEDYVASPYCPNCGARMDYKE